MSLLGAALLMAFAAAACALFMALGTRRGGRAPGRPAPSAGSMPSLASARWLHEVLFVAALARRSLPSRSTSGRADWEFDTAARLYKRAVFRRRISYAPQDL